ncbi:hypothetical protein [uncultured Massilia sp.]|uniref:cupredoxin domain-containing protein n=1 Tax=uncultured Massilia sp. TaxID=169973 RepID=UPI0025F4819D|nr:hypothetical protein [uncultured Massilia sp.]
MTRSTAPDADARSRPAPAPGAAGLLRRVRWTLAAGLLALLLWAALWPLRYPTRERVFDFPRGAGILKARGVAVPVPARVRLALGVRDVLLLRNRDLSAHVFGQVLVLPGRTLRLPFEQAGDFAFACDIAPGHAVRVSVLPHPDPGWDRLRWRLHALADALRELPVHGPDD